jgi:hypothetical protein
LLVNGPPAQHNTGTRGGPEHQAQLQAGAILVSYRQDKIRSSQPFLIAAERR